MSSLIVGKPPFSDGSRCSVWPIADWSLWNETLASGVGRQPGGLPEAIIIAASELRDVTTAVGKSGHRVLTELVGYEMSIQQIAERHGLNRQEMTGVCKAVLERLAEHYGECGT